MISNALKMPFQLFACLCFIHKSIIPQYSHILENIGRLCILAEAMLATLELFF